MNSLNKRWRWWQKALVVLVVFVVALIIFHKPLLTFTGEGLVAEDRPEEADLIVVLMGSIPDRILQGVELYQEGYAETILMVRSGDEASQELASKYQIDVLSNVNINKDIALQLGVPDEDIIIMGQALADSTEDEALAVRKYVEEQGIESLLLVTSSYHSRRAQMIFERELGELCRVISIPSEHDPFDSGGWWKDRRQARNFFMEYMKLVNFYIFRF